MNIKKLHSASSVKQAVNDKISNNEKQGFDKQDMHKKYIYVCEKNAESCTDAFCLCYIVFVQVFVGHHFGSEDMECHQDRGWESKKNLTY